MNQAGFVVVAMAGLWIAYLVPHRLRYRQQLLESRTDDRFSEHLRVLRVAQVTADRLAPGPTVVRGATQGPGARSTRVRLHVTRAAVATGGEPARRAGRGDGSMDRPHATRDRLAADAARQSAAEHGRRAAHLARRTAAARRRALLTLVLTIAVATGWSVVGLAGAAILIGVVPTVALVAVLGLGRRAVVAGAQADAQWEAGASTRVPLPASSRRTGATGRAVRPSDGTTEVMARVPAVQVTASTTASTTASSPVTTPRSTTAVAVGAAASDDQQAAAPRVTTRRITAEAEARAAETGTWEPVPVPRPAYTLKPAARRAEPAPLVLDDEPGASSRRRAADETPAETADERPAEDLPLGTPEVTSDLAAPEQAPVRAGLDLDAILARRRASGE